MSPCFDVQENFGPDGCAIFYRKNVFQIRNMSCDKVVAPGNGASFDSQVFIILQLKHLPSGKHVTVVSLHLKSKEQNYAKRKTQIEYILRVVEKHVRESSRGYKSTGPLNAHPVIVCGDFNGEPFEEFYSVIYHNKFFGFRDAYSQLTTRSPDGNRQAIAKQPTTIKYRDSFIKRAIDYVFYREKCLELTEYLELPVDDETVNEQGLPNLTYSSDHLALACGFKFVV